LERAKEIGCGSLAAYAIKAGIITDTTKDLLESAEKEKADIKIKLDSIKQSPEVITPATREIYLKIINGIHSLWII